MSYFRKHSEKRMDFGVHTRPNTPKHRRDTINLQPSFYKRHPWASAAVAILVAVFSFLGLQRFYTRAAVEDFYPATCLGSWQKTANAEGKPEMANAMNDEAGFTTGNSSVYTGGDARIFCGSFVRQNYEAIGNITSVGLTLVWRVGEAGSSTISEDSAEASTTITAASTTVATTTIASTTASTTPDDVVSPDADSSSTMASPIPTSTSFTISRFFAQEFMEYAFADESSSDVDVQTDVVAPTPESAPTPTSTSEPAPSPAPEAPTGTITTDDTSTAISPSPEAATSTVIATSTIVTSTIATSALPTSTIMASAPSTSTITEASGTSATGTVPDMVVPPPPPDENFLSVSYSTDGETWIDLGFVNLNNWPNFTVTLPIADWNDLKNLQVRVKSIPTTQDPVPPVYLDGMFVEVHYDIPPLLDDGSQNSAVTTSSSISATGSTTASLTAPSLPPPPPISDPGALQTCSAEPFSNTFAEGASGTISISFSPHALASAYQLAVGTLPQGVSGYLAPISGAEAPTTSTLFLQVASDAKPGSFNAIVVYNEYYPSAGKMLANFCQMNLIIAK